MVVLTEELVLQKTRSEDLATVRNLNLWGSDLSDVAILQVAAARVHTHRLSRERTAPTRVLDPAHAP